MAEHGYLREYDEGWDRGDEPERGWRSDRDPNDRSRDRGFMLGDGDRSFSQRMGDTGPSRQQGFGGGGDWERSPRNFRSHQDDHYRSWRDRQIQALDRDYEDYCREREQQFHSDFDNWRRNRGKGRQPTSVRGGSSEDVMELNNPRAEATEFDSTSSPVADATLGTNNSENTLSGRR